VNLDRLGLPVQQGQLALKVNLALLVKRVPLVHRVRLGLPVLPVLLVRKVLLEMMVSLEPQVLLGLLDRRDQQEMMVQLEHPEHPEPLAQTESRHSKLPRITGSRATKQLGLPA
jgi:hypothetical protein